MSDFFSVIHIYRLKRVFGCHAFHIHAPGIILGTCRPVFQMSSCAGFKCTLSVFWHCSRSNWPTDTNESSIPPSFQWGIHICCQNSKISNGRHLLDILEIRHLEIRFLDRFFDIVTVLVGVENRVKSRFHLFFSEEFEYAIGFKLSWKLKKIEILSTFRPGGNFFIVSESGSWIYVLDGQSTGLRSGLLNLAVASEMTELWRC